MSANLTRRSTSELLVEIRARLDVVEEHMVWLIKPEQRFRIGQRIEFSRRARRRGINSRTRSDTGEIEKIDGFSVVVRLDGYKRARRYHHAFFNPLRGPKLF